MALDPAVLEKAHAAEHRVALVRWAVIAFNSILYVAFLEKAGTIPWLAWTIIVVAWTYSLFVIFARPYERFEVMMSVYFTSLTDASLILLWILATGAWGSPFYVLWYVSIVAVAFRFALDETLAVAAFYSAAYGGLLILAEGAIPEPSVFAVEIGYIFLVGWLAGLISQETYQQTRAKLEMKELAEASGGLTEDLEVGRVATKAVDAGRRLASADRGALFMLDRSQGTLSCLHADGLSATYLEAVTRAYRNLPGGQLLEGESYVHVADVSQRTDLGPLGGVIQDEGVATFLVVPLSIYGEPVGALALYRDEVAPFSSEEIELVRSLGSHTASAIESARLIEELRSSEERWRSLVDHAPNLILLVDPEGIVQFLNRGIGEISPEDVVGTDIHDWVPETHVSILQENLDAVFDAGETRTYEVPGPGGDGETAWYATRAGPIRDGDEVVAALLISLDITDRKRVEEELRRSNADLEQFAYVASHDLQEPLRMVASYVQLLERRYEDQLDEDALTYIGYAAEGAQRMQSLIKDLLTYSRVDASDDPFQATGLTDLLGDVTGELAGTIRETDAAIRYGDLPTVQGDPNQLRQVFRNLLTNAIKFRGEQPPEVTITAERNDGAWLIEVADNGIGIPADYSDKVFQLFQRLNSRGQYPGTGIGLAICRKVIQRHGGEIWVDPNDQGGSSFRFTLPVRPEPPGRARQLRSRQQADDPKRPDPPALGTRRDDPAPTGRSAAGPSAQKEPRRPGG